MPLSIISTDYMQLDLLYSFLLSAWTDTRRFRLQIHRYMCVFLYSMKERAVTGITWLPGVEGQRSGLHCLSKATIQSLFPPLPRVTLSNNKKHKKQKKTQNKNKG